MTPYHDADGITIYHGDVRDILPALDIAADLVLTDPPYGIGYVSGTKDASRPRQHFMAAGIVGDESLNTMREAMPLLDRLLAADRHAYFFAAPARIGEATDVVAQYWRVKNLLVWDKGCMGRRGDLVAGYGTNFEMVIYAAKGMRPLARPRPLAVYRYDWFAKRDPVHPMVKPVPLMSWLIGNSTRQGELVIDPFMGSGPTLRAARDLGRRAIGIDIDERSCEVAAKRVGG